MSPAREACGVCGGRGSRVVAAISDPHWVMGADGRPTIARTFAIPIVAPCICTIKRAAIGVRP